MIEAEPAQLTVTDANGTALVVTARAVGVAGNGIVLANDNNTGPTSPTITDSSLTVTLSSAASSTFAQVSAAINASSLLVDAVVIGDGTTAFGADVAQFAGNLSGGADEHTDDSYKAALMRRTLHPPWNPETSSKTSRMLMVVGYSDNDIGGLFGVADTLSEDV